MRVSTRPSITAPAIQTSSGEGVGYTFSDTVATDHKVAICELLAKWEATGEEERGREERSMSVKAPEGDVVLFPGAITFVHSSKTNHLWRPVNHPPSPRAMTPRQTASGVRVGVREHGTNPWRGKKAGVDSFEPIGSARNGCIDSIAEGEKGEAEVGGSAETGRTGRKQPERGAARYAADDFTPREVTGKNSASEENENGLTERESRAASEPGSSSQKTSARKVGLGDKGKIRKGRFRGKAPSVDRDMPADRLRHTSAATDSASEDESTRLRTVSSPGYEPPRNQHRKLRPLAMNEQLGASKIAAAELSAGGGASTPATATTTVTPSAPAKSKPSRALKTFW